MISNEKAILMIAVMAVFTFLTRAIPFLFFSLKMIKTYVIVCHIYDYSLKSQY